MDEGEGGEEEEEEEDPIIEPSKEDTLVGTQSISIIFFSDPFLCRYFFYDFWFALILGD